MILTENKPSVQELLHVPYVELSFGVIGETLPADHGYGLYSAISKQYPKFHDLEDLALNTICGEPNRQGEIVLTENSRLSLRCPSSSLMAILPLAGMHIGLGKHTLRLGNPEIYQLRAYSELKARLVTIKHPSGKFDSITPNWFLDACDRQLQALGIQASVGIPLNEADEPARKTMQIKTKGKLDQKQKAQRDKYQIVGYGVIVADLLPEDSILLQVKGIGGKRKMGCGYFVPYRLK
jgi:CRISPR-associated protein Cas6